MCQLQTLVTPLSRAKLERKLLAYNGEAIPKDVAEIYSCLQTCYVIYSLATYLILTASFGIPVSMNAAPGLKNVSHSQDGHVAAYSFETSNKSCNTPINLCEHFLQVTSVTEFVIFLP